MKRDNLRKHSSVNSLNSAAERVQPKRIEYILEGNLLEKSVKRPFCCTVPYYRFTSHICAI